MQPLQPRCLEDRFLPQENTATSCASASLARRWASWQHSNEYNTASAKLSETWMQHLQPRPVGQIPPSAKPRKSKASLKQGRLSPRFPTLAALQNSQITCTATVGLPRKHSVVTPDEAHRSLLMTGWANSFALFVSVRLPEQSSGSSSGLPTDPILLEILFDSSARCPYRLVFLSKTKAP